MNALERGRRDCELAAAYEGGEPVASLVRRGGVSQTQLYRILRRRGVQLRAPSKGRRRRQLSVEDERAIAVSYSRGTSKEALARDYSCSTSRVRRILRDGDIAHRSPIEAHPRRHAVRHDAFAELTPESAYWTGLAMADGCIARERTLQITLHVKDIEHLSCLYEFVGCPGRPVAQRDNMAIASVHSKRLVADLIRHGVVPRKSWGTRASEAMAAAPSFWLGMIDGDGSIFFSRAPLVSLCGSRPLMEQYQAFLAATVLDGRRQAVHVRRPDGLCSVVVEGRTAQRLLRRLYDASPTSLPRKRVIAERILAWENSRPRERVFSTDRSAEWSEKRQAWAGASSLRKHHASHFRALSSALLGKRGFSDLVGWKPSVRSSMVAFEGRKAGRLALIWVTPRWRAEIPAAVCASDHEVYVLHVSPAQPGRSWLNRYDGRRTSFVPARLLRELAAEAR